LTLGSLFDGIGGFPLAAAMNGITPVWASEIEAAPISITKRHFPDMKHLGDITKINGAEIEPVDIVTFGSPCQDLSLAGKRAGIKGERSGLFMEAVRVIKEMRGKTNGEYPKRIVWENVPGAFSSNEGEDFRIVIEEIANIAGGAISIPRPPARSDGSDAVWDGSGCVMGDGWSLAWRVLDAQYWGVPQRRKRIFLVADFRGKSAAEILFKPDSVPGDTAESRTEGEGAAADSKRGVRASGFNGWRGITGSMEYQEECAPCLQTKMPPNAVYGLAARQQSQNIGENVSPPILATDYKEPNCVFVDGYNQDITGDVAPTLKGQRVDASNIGLVFENHGQDCRVTGPLDTSPTISQKFGTGGNNVPLVLKERVIAFEPGIMSRDGGHIYENIAGTLRANAGDNQLAVAYSIQGSMIGRDDKNGPQGDGINEDICFTLNTTDRHAIAVDCRNFAVNENVSGTLQAKENGGQSLNYINPVATFAMQGFGDHKQSDIASNLKSRGQKDSTDLIGEGYAVRRLTPLECERLQGFPDGWTEYGIADIRLKGIKKYCSENYKELPGGEFLRKIPDSARYKAIGNSVAVPCVDFIMSRIAGGVIK